MADFKLLRRFSCLSVDARLSIECRFSPASMPSLLTPYGVVTVRLSPEQNDVGRVDKEASDRVLPNFARVEANVMSDNDETTCSRVEGDNGSREGTVEPSPMEFRSVEELDDRTGEDKSTTPEAIDAASGAAASISGKFKPNWRASSESRCARASSASTEAIWRTSHLYLPSSRAGSDVFVDTIVYVQVAMAPIQRARMERSGRRGEGARGQGCARASRGAKSKKNELVHGTTSTVDERLAHNDSIRPYCGGRHRVWGLEEREKSGG